MIQQTGSRTFCKIPSPSGGGLGWGQAQARASHRACHHPRLPPEGEGVIQSRMAVNLGIKIDSSPIDTGASSSYFYSKYSQASHAY